MMYTHFLNNCGKLQSVAMLILIKPVDDHVVEVHLLLFSFNPLQDGGPQQKIWGHERSLQVSKYTYS